MLGLRFNLTPAQTEALVVIANDCYRDCNGYLLPDYESSYFVPTFHRLIDKGLVTHEPKRNPTFQVTDEGRAVAKLVEKQCKHLLSYSQRQNKTRTASTRVIGR